MVTTELLTVELVKLWLLREMSQAPTCLPPKAEYAKLQ